MTVCIKTIRQTNKSTNIHTDQKTSCGETVASWRVLSTNQFDVSPVCWCRCLPARGVRVVGVESVVLAGRLPGTSHERGQRIVWGFDGGERGEETREARVAVRAGEEAGTGNYWTPTGQGGCMSGSRGVGEETGTGNYWMPTGQGGCTSGSRDRNRWLLDAHGAGWLYEREKRQEQVTTGRPRGRVAVRVGAATGTGNYWTPTGQGGCTSGRRGRNR